ncbi:MAG: Bug family tripartite tricarboxylate transporter substrate binding protein [Reyranella sp.]|uniref:Bug family tripartite tricarboxylate transporter substrate binding protein n=1 Tax=Reyranella sp. TaxID=1929291 RepID=UPI003D1389D5
MKRRTMLKMAASAAIVGAPIEAQAQAYPSQTVRVVVPGPAGNALDALARLMCGAMGKSLDTTFVIDNKPGASGHIGGEFVARAKPDGYTLLFGASTTHVVSPHILTDLKYKPLDDFDPITLVAKVHNVLVCHPELPVKSVGELIDYAKANPGKLSFGSTGIGSNLHLGMELFMILTGTSMQHVPYSSAALQLDLIAGRIQLLLDNMPVAVPNVRAGKVRPLGVASRERQPELPEVPPIADTIPGYEVGAWGVLMAPKGTPPAVITRLNETVRNALAQPEVRDGFLKQSFHPAPMTPAETAAFMRGEYDKWAKVVREANIKAS